MLSPAKPRAMNRAETIGRAVVGLAGIVLGLGVCAVADREEDPPPLVGDGFHDDTAAIQWQLDHPDCAAVRVRNCRITQTLILR